MQSIPEIELTVGFLCLVYTSKGSTIEKIEKLGDE
jgi:hypothetical protein